jgi:hypothetical protein
MDRKIEPMFGAYRHDERHLVGINPRDVRQLFYSMGAC